MNASHAKPDEVNDVQVRLKHVYPEGITSKPITGVFARGRPRDDRANYPNFEAPSQSRPRLLPGYGTRRQMSGASRRLGCPLLFSPAVRRGQLAAAGMQL